MTSTEKNSLSTYFGSKRGLSVIDGVGGVIERQATLLEKDLHELENLDWSELDNDDDITAAKKLKLKMDYVAALQKRIDARINSLVRNGNTLAKLRDPSLNRPSVSLTLNAAAGTSSAEWSDRQLAAAVDVLEAQGFPREGITEQMAYNLLIETEGEPKKALPVAGPMIIDAEPDDAEGGHYEGDDDDF